MTRLFLRPTFRSAVLRHPLTIWGLAARLDCPPPTLAFILRQDDVAATQHETVELLYRLADLMEVSHDQIFERLEGEVTPTTEAPGA